MKELSMELKADGAKPLYQQIYEYIRAEIIKQNIKQGEKLPSTRFLSEYLEVSRSTVELAYDQLTSEGYIEAEPYRGFFVCDVTEVYDLRAERMSEGQLQMSMKTNENHWEKHTKKYLYDFSPNGVDLSVFPFKTWSNITRTLLLDQGEELFVSGEARGDLSFRCAIANYLHQARGVNCSPEQIIVGAGNEYLQMLLAQILEGKFRIAMESPAYLPAYYTFRNLGFFVSPVELDREGMRVDQLENSGADIAYVMPSHQFPTGTVMPMKRRLELLAWAAGEPDRYIIEDDYDSEFRYRGKPIPSLQGSDRFGRVIYLGTFSRSIAPATRVSYMVLPLPLLEQYKKACGFYASTVPRLMQSTIFHFIQEGYFERNLNKMRVIYKKRHELLIDYLKGCGWCDKIRGEHSGLHLLVQTNLNCTEQEVIAKLAREGIRVYGLSEYNIGGKCLTQKPVLIFGFGGMKEDELMDGLKKTGKILH
ncbi:HTH-type transcriptional regulatory protein gabR [uncultured Roseburia sp.]|uniref:PLP-dependent aminotransferase family protein n=1 Tax=Brotonthovivens ammoniilytica TaxID=2981725 RepID=A0ABT2TQ80_9FIRM|nr:PLP-dependent aminotransferase family protein [Brotonthovivens ammoniilytica]MCU6763634.1 PLP-dependent aminotransferase family protein [Brotonthovivens ammoniilytica]SCJ28814.1 HTH-type transcriptional regulatory protein gabR [uncultured Roseburia sp.]